MKDQFTNGCLSTVWRMDTVMVSGRCAPTSETNLVGRVNGDYNLVGRVNGRLT